MPSFFVTKHLHNKDLFLPQRLRVASELAILLALDADWAYSSLAVLFLFPLDPSLQ